MDNFYYYSNFQYWKGVTVVKGLAQGQYKSWFAKYECLSP